MVLASLRDNDALWFSLQARRAGRDCVLVTTEALSFARRRSHRQSDDGTETLVELADGQVLSSARTDGVLNRAVEAPATAWRRASAGERAYAGSELHAFLLSWLSSLPCPVRNTPTPECLAGPVAGPLRLAAAALAAGLSCPAVRVGCGEDPVDRVLATAAWSSAGADARPRQVVVLDGEPFGAGLHPAVRDGSAALARALGAAHGVVGLDFLVAGATWWLAGATPLPRLRSAGPELLPALLQVLDPVTAPVS